MMTLRLEPFTALKKKRFPQETTDLIESWRNIVKQGVYQLSNGKWKKFHDPKFLRGEKRTIGKRLSEKIRRLESAAVEITNRPNQNQQQTDYFADWQFTEARNFEKGIIPQHEKQPSSS